MASHNASSLFRAIILFVIGVVCSVNNNILLSLFFFLASLWLLDKGDDG